MKLSKKTILENPDKTLREMFPEVFEVKLEVGKWYKLGTGGVFNYQIELGGYFIGYGLSKYGDWFDDFCENISVNVVPANHKELETALIAEAKKRGYADGNYKCLSGGSTVKHNDNYIFENGNLYSGWEHHFRNVIFKNGKWAEIIPTMTKEEAEEKLKCKIK